MKLEQERLDGFQSRMNEWVAKQGLLFQLRYAGSVQGSKNSALTTVFRIIIRLLVLVVIASLAFWIYLIRRVDSESFLDDLSGNVASALHSETIEVRGLERDRGYLHVASINIIGGEHCGFEDLELRAVKTPMGLGDGLFTPWSGDALQVGSMRAYLKGGADSDEAAAAAFQSLFWNSENFNLRTIAVEDANLKWGYSSSNSGQIVGSKLMAKRVGAGWSLVLTGGEFSQNWLKGLEIVRIEAELSPDGVHIHEARLKNQDAELSFTLAMVSGGASPDFEGKGAFKNLPINDYIEGQYLSLLDGRISGTFAVSGSTNRQTGFQITSDVELGEGDLIELRDRIPLFRALSTADRFRSYKKVRLKSGTFRMTTGNGVMQIEDLTLAASRLMRLEGAFKVRPPEEEELDSKFELTQRNQVALLSEGGEDSGDDAFTFSLRKAAEKDDDRPKDEVKSSILLNEKYGAEVGRNLAEGARERELQKVFLDGELRLGVVAASFERSPALSKAFPVDEETDLRWLELSWKAVSPFAVGEALAKEIFEMSGVRE